jgi:hypothetical protein
MAAVEEKPKADKAEFKAVEKPVELVDLPDLQKQPEKKKGRFGRPVKEEAKETESKPKIPKVTTDQALRPTLEMAAIKWNEYLDAPLTGDPSKKFRWNDNDTTMAIKALEALDAKYDFMSHWIDYAPEIFALTVFGGIIGKLIMGARYKNAQDKNKAAAPDQTVKPANPSPIERVREAVSKTLTPKPPGEKNLMDQMPPDLIQQGKDYLNRP